MMKQIITRPDFDGVVCAVLLKAALGEHLPTLWVQPSEIQKGQIGVGPEDIIANLPIYGNCAMWFDHHVSNEPRAPYKGLYRVAPSAAGLIYEYYKDKISARFQPLVDQADKIDDAQLNLDEILHPENYPYILLSMSITARDASDLAYCDKLVALLSNHTIEEVLSDPQVKQRCDGVSAENKAYEAHLRKHTRIEGLVSVTDFRGLDPIPNGNRFLIYSLYPDTVVNMKILHEHTKTVVKLGHSILNRGCNVNVGKLLSHYGGGGHRGAGAGRIDEKNAQRGIQEILDVLIANKADE
jgi:hypothetical protein